MAITTNRDSGAIAGREEPYIPLQWLMATSTDETQLNCVWRPVHSQFETYLLYCQKQGQQHGGELTHSAPGFSLDYLYEM